MSWHIRFSVVVHLQKTLIMAIAENVPDSQSFAYRPKHYHLFKQNVFKCSNFWSIFGTMENTCKIRVVNTIAKYWTGITFAHHFRGVTPRKKYWIRNLGEDMYAHVHSIFCITTNFHEIQLSGFRGVALTNCFRNKFLIFVKFLRSKGAALPGTKVNQNFLQICASTHYVHLNYKVSEELHWQEKQDWRTDWLTDWWTIPLATCCIAWV